jgi:hypothetical protein
MATTFKFGNGNWAVKEDYALAYNDENGNFKPLPFDFTRASTATRVNKDGLVETVPSGKPRIDFLNNTSGHLLLEPSRTNRVPYSVFDGNLPTGWSVGFGTGTFTHELTTFRGQSAIKHTQLTSGRSYLQDSVTLSAGTTYTCSFYVDLENSGDIPSNEVIASVNFSDDTGDDEVTFGEIDQDTGLAKFTFTTVTDVVGELRLGFGCFGTTSTTNKPLIFSMPQIEEGSYPTSYIPTEGSSVTRSAEECFDSANSTIVNDSEGVLYAEIAALANDGTQRRITLSEGGYTNRMVIELSSVSNRIAVAMASSTLSFTQKTYTTTDATEFHKIALRWDSDGFDFYVNGSQRGSHGTSPNYSNDVLDDLSFTNVVGSQEFFGKAKDLRIYNTALSDTEMAQLTS